RCGNRAVPPATGYMPPSSACTSARMMMMTPARSQARTAAPPISCAAKNAPNSQPEPIMEVSDAQVAPISPISLLKPTSPGLMSCDNLAMIDSSFLDRAPGGMPPAGGVRFERVSASYELSEIIVEMINLDEKCCAGFGFITQVRGVQPACRRN